MSSKMIENLLKPSLACAFLGIDFLFMADVVLLNLDPVMAEASS